MDDDVKAAPKRGVTCYEIIESAVTCSFEGLFPCGTSKTSGQSKKVLRVHIDQYDIQRLEMG